MNTFKNLADTLAARIKGNLSDVERLVRWQEHAGLCNVGRFMPRAAFCEAYEGVRVHQKALAALVEVVTLAEDHAEELAGVSDRAGWLLANIERAAPIDSVRRIAGLSFIDLGYVLNVPAASARRLCGADWWKRGEDHDALFVALAGVLAGRLAG